MLRPIAPRKSESEYWSKVAKDVKLKGANFIDNIWKRQALLRRLLDYNWIEESVLEIGVGGGLTAAVLNLMSLGRMNYVGTDLAPEFCEFVSKQWKLTMMLADVRHIPIEDATFTRIIALDTLEHVRPEDREQGNKEIGRLLSPGGMILLNIPCNESGHVDEFDHGYGREDVDRLCSTARVDLVRWEPYSIRVNDTQLDYVFAVMARPK